MARAPSRNNCKTGNISSASSMELNTWNAASGQGWYDSEINTVQTCVWEPDKASSNGRKADMLTRSDAWNLEACRLAGWDINRVLHTLSLDSKPELLECCIHVMDSRYLGKNREEHPYYREFSAGEEPGSCICDYEKFPILLHERLTHAVSPPALSLEKPLTMKQKSSASKLSEAFPISNLPREIRLCIYELALTLSGALEICPEPWNFRDTITLDQTERDDFKKSWEPIEMHQMKKLTAFSKAAGLLRTCKWINEEAKPFLYRNNHFSFTNTSGWIGLDWFLHKIGNNNCRELRHVAVRHPAHLILPATLEGSIHLEMSILAVAMPKSYPVDWLEKSVSMEPARVLRQIPLLRSLTLLLPFYQEPPNPLEGMEDASSQLYSTYAPFMDMEDLLPLLPNSRTHRRLRTTLLSLRGEDCPTRKNELSMAVMMAANIEGDHPELSGIWRSAEATYNHVGDYEI